MRILYVAMRHDYGHPEGGDSFEHCNFFDSLRGMGHDILYFDYPAVMSRLGRHGMNRRLLEIAKAERPELMFTVLFRDEFEPTVLRQISDFPDTTTLNWFCDDHWRFEDFSRHWAPAFNWVVTTDSAALPKYAAIGCQNVIKSQWACNHFLYRRLDLPLKYDVTFVGKPHGNRRDVIDALRDIGIRVHVWGKGWGHGRAGQQEMIEIFNRSRINLNLANASGAGRRRKWQRALGHAAHLARRSCGQVQSVQAAARRFAAAGECEQIKGRNFEVPGCGGFLMTGSADNLPHYYQPDREVVAFDTFADMAYKIRHYLEHEDQRAAVADAGYQRTLAEHTYAHRFAEIFARLQLPAEAATRSESLEAPPHAAALAASAPIKAGTVVEAA